jgi:hypothetical protein
VFFPLLVGNQEVEVVADVREIEIGWDLWGFLPHFLPQRDCLLAVPGYGSQTRPEQRDGPALAGDHALPLPPTATGGVTLGQMPDIWR